MPSQDDCATFKIMLGPSAPPPADNEQRTLNKTGMGTRYRDAMADAGIAFSKHRQQPVLDIGCGFGNVTIPLLAQGNKVIANDISQEHLDAVLAAAPAHAKARLTLALGAFPHQPRLERASITSVISCWTFNFMAGVELEKAAQKLFAAVVPDGKVYISAHSPYLKYLSKFIPEFERRRAEGDRYPGWIDKMRAYAEPEHIENLPESMHFFDSTVLRRVFFEAGFVVEYSDYFRRADVTEAMALDGRENIGLIARRP